MDNIYNLTIKRYLCPYCGKWHKLQGIHKLSNYNLINPLILHCPNMQYECSYTLYCHEIYFYSEFFPCIKDTSLLKNYFNGNLHIPENHANILLFAFSVLIDKDIYLPINKCQFCQACKFSFSCNLSKIAKNSQTNLIEIPLAIEFEVP